MPPAGRPDVPRKPKKGRVSIKTSIFTRTLAATLLPLVVIFSMVLITISRIVFSAENDYIKERTFFFADRLRSQLQDRITSMSDVLPIVANSLENIDPGDSDAENEAVAVLLSLFRFSEDICNVWCAFEPNEFSGPNRFTKSYIRSGDVFVEVFDMQDDVLDDPERSPWYNVPKTADKLFFIRGGLTDYGTHRQARYVSSFSFPLKRNGRFVGCIGFDIAYSRLLRHIDEFQIPGTDGIHLLSDSGQLVYSSPQKYRDMSLSGFPLRGEIQAAMNSEKTEPTWYGEDISPFSGKSSMTCLYPIPVSSGKKFFLYIDLPADTLYARAYAAVRVILATSLLGLILVTASVFLTVRNIVKPIKKITNNAHKLALGELDVVFESLEESAETKNEVTILQIALKKMLDQIHQIQSLKLEAVRSAYEREKTEENMRAKVRFFAAISHEIRTPMNAVLGLSDLLLDESLSVGQRKFIGDIKMSAESLLDIVNDVLDFSKLDMEQTELSCDNYSPVELLENIRAMIAPMTANRELEFRCEIADNIPECLCGDFLKLRQILLNLLGNAVKYTHRGFVSLTASYENGHLFFEVADSGIGMKQEDLPVIFEAFRQLPQEKNRHIQGTGLGLTITKKLIGLMNGEITVQSVYGRGSCFAVRIPAPAGDGSALGKNRDRSQNFRISTAKILVVDDNEINLNVAEGLLSRYAITADAAASGREALRKIRNNDYDIVFMDHMMPEMDGVEAVRKIREMGGRYKDLAVVALTANAVAGTKDFLLEKGMNDFLSKPIDRNALGEVLLKWIPADKVTFGDDGAETPPESEASKTVGRLAEVRELNVALGMERASRSAELYEKITRRMRDAIPGFREEACTLLWSGDHQTFRIKLHGMKNSLANVGAVRLSERAKKLEAAASSGDIDFCEEHLPDFLERLTAFEKKLGQILGTDNAAARKTYCDPARLRLAVRRLYDALSANDYSAVLEAEREVFECDFGKEYGDTPNRLKELIDQFEYEAAIDAIRTAWPDVADTKIRFSMRGLHRNKRPLSFDKD